jgi:hypothetical protein
MTPNNNVKNLLIKTTNLFILNLADYSINGDGHNTADKIRFGIARIGIVESTPAWYNCLTNEGGGYKICPLPHCIYANKRAKISHYSSR